MDKKSLFLKLPHFSNHISQTHTQENTHLATLAQILIGRHLMLSARRLVASSLLKKTNSISFLISTPTTLPISVPTRSYNKGSRGHGWYVKYRRGDGGRHLQGFQFDQTHYSNLNDKLFAHQAKSTTTAYLTIDTSTDATKGGRIELEVLSSLLPLAGSNFLKLLSHPDGYQNSTIMRVEKEVGVIFGGHKNACHPDLASLPGGTHFDDEG